MTRILVTGGFGYVGGRSLRVLRDDPALRLTVATRRAVTAPEGLEVRRVNWREAGEVAALCQGIDTVIHLTTMAEPGCDKDPEGALLDNGLATLRLLEAAVAGGVRRFVYVSTSKVFGAGLAGRIDEASVPRPLNHYAITHRLAEDYVLASHAKGRIEGAVLRLSNGMGAPADPGVDAWTLISNDLCRQAATKGTITLQSSGLAWRNFIAMADVVGALRHVLALPKERLQDGLFHVGGPASLRILDLAHTIAARAQAVLGAAVTVTRPEPAPGENHPPLDWRTDKLAATGWSPATGLETEIDATLGYCRSWFGKA